MKTKTKILLACLLGSVFLSNADAGPEKETRYLAFQIFTYGPNPIIATMGEGKHPQPARFPDKAVLRDYIGDSGRDPSAIAKTMEEKFKPLMEAGKVGEAEAELDRVLEQLKPDGKSTESPTAPAHAAQDIPVEVREKLAHNIGCSFLLFRDKVRGN